jgi:type II secretion system protein G
MKNAKFDKGFTLVELLVVIGVLGVLVTGVLIAVNPAQQLAKARDASRKSAIKQIRNALEQYRTVHGSYPTREVGGWPAVYLYSVDPQWQTFLGSELKSVPVDPTQDSCSSPTHPWLNSSSSCWRFAYYSPNGSDYRIVAHLENKSDPDRCEVKKWKWFNGNILCGDYSWSIYSYTLGPND